MPPLLQEASYYRVVFLTFLVLGCVDSSLSPGLPVALTPCDVPFGPNNTTTQAQCGTHEVYENRQAQSGRKIPLHIVVLPALNASPAPDPVFYLAGGPGQSAAGSVGFIGRVHLAQVRQDRDLVFVDLRGTGKSNPLTCQVPGSPDRLQTYMGVLFGPEVAEPCLPHLAEKADLRFYTNAVAMDDLDEVRAALGYERINLYGTSGGTRAALVFTRRHPERVRSLLLNGLVPTYFRGPASYAQDMERALDQLLLDCTADEACHEAFPDLRANLYAVLARLRQGPVELELLNPETNEREQVALTYDPFVALVRSMLYSPFGSAQLPFLIAQAASGDYTPAAERIINNAKRVPNSASLGVFHAIMCNEDVAFVEVEAARLEAAGTVLGEGRLQQQVDACARWPRGEVTQNFTAPVTADVPALLLSGALDPVTPPRWGDAVAKNFPNSHHLVVPNAGHFVGNAFPGCLDGLVADFFATGTLDQADTACVAQIQRPPFRVLEGE